jgi:hypothetical protein
MPPPAAVVLDPHVGAAIVCLAMAVVAALLAFALGLADDEDRRK